MNSLLKQITVVISILSIGFLIVWGQTAEPSKPTEAKTAQTTTETKKASVKFTAKAEINGNNQNLGRKRFYLIRGSRQQNAELIKKIAETPAVSPDCYYANLRQQGRQISDQFLCWLKNNDCESPYCREIKTKEEALAVPEFAVAYNKSLREYGRSPLLALKWLTTNLDDELRDGYYRQQKMVTREMVNLARTYAQEATRAKTVAAKPGDGFQSIMTDRIGNAYFLDIDVVPPEGKKTETYLISNLLPIVFGDTGYVWTCEIEIDPAKPQAPVRMDVLIKNKKCEVAEKKITQSCSLPDCGKKAETAPASAAAN